MNLSVLNRFLALGSIFALLTGCLKKSDTYLNTSALNQPSASVLCAQIGAYATPSECQNSQGFPLVTQCVSVAQAAGQSMIACYKLPTECQSGQICKMLNNGSINSGTWGGRSTSIDTNACLGGMASSQVSLSGILISCE